jgi:hypothetical protein
MSDGLLMTVSMRRALPSFRYLDAAVLVAKVHLHLGPRAEDPGREGLSSGAATTVAPEHGVDFVGAPDADVVGDERLEEASGSARVVEDERARDLDLAH